MTPLNLRASSAHRWMICPGSVRACASLRDISNIYAERGTVAHALLEMGLVLDLEDEELYLYEGKIMPDASLPQIPIDEEMIRGVGHALDFVRSYVARNPRATYFSESQIDLSKHTGYWITGTSDLIIDNCPEELVVADYKHGVVGVDEEENPQLLVYALGYILSRGIKPKAIRFVIIQPRARDNRPPVREVVVRLRDVLNFAERMTAAAKAAHEPNAPRYAGTHCRFCRAAGTCKANMNQTLEAAKLEFSDLQNEEAEMNLDMEDSELAIVLSASERVRAWLIAVEHAAIERMLEGKTIEGYKVVGSQTRRRWADESKVLKLIPANELDRFAPRSPITPTQIEKLANMKRRVDQGAQAVWEKAAQYVIRNPQEPRVAPSDDPRPHFVPGQEFQDSSQ